MIKRKKHYEFRRQTRVKDNRRVRWQLNDGERQGKGRVRNISASGMLFEVDGNFKPRDESIIDLDSDLGFDNYIPPRGRLVWHKKKPFPGRAYLCGVEFHQPTGIVAAKLNEKVDVALWKEKHLRWIRFGLNTLMIVSLCVLAFLFIRSSERYYEDMNLAHQKIITNHNQQQMTFFSLLGDFRETQALYQQSMRQQASMETELSATKTMLSETERLLEESRLSNQTLKSELESARQANVSAINAREADFQATIARLREENSRINDEVAGLKDRLSRYERDITSVGAAEEQIGFYREKIRDVNRKAREIHREARAAKTEVLREEDRIRVLLGNNGYLIKGGEIVSVDEKAYREADPSALAEAPSAPAKVNIDVTFVE